jgi:hypothetical protein
MSLADELIFRKIFKEIYRPLLVLTKILIKSKKWFRGYNTYVTIAGKEPDDYVFEALAICIENSQKIKIEKEVLFKISRNIIFTLIGNDCRSFENKTTVVIEEYLDTGNDNNDDVVDFLDTIFPHSEPFFDQQFDYDLIMSDIENEVIDDIFLKKLFICICCFAMKRREVCRDFDITEKEYDNGVRRLKTILNRIALKYDLIIKKYEY